MGIRNLAIAGVTLALAALLWFGTRPTPPRAPKPLAPSEQAETKPVASSPVFASVAQLPATKQLIGKWRNVQRIAASPAALEMETVLELEANGGFRARVVINGKHSVNQVGTWSTQGERLIYNRTGCTVQGQPFGQDTCPDKPTPPARFKLDGDRVQLQPESGNSPALMFDRVTQ